jgi:surfeit locus 1 family protein
MLLLKMFQRKWLIPTLLVLAGTALCIRLGFWQLERLEQRRAFNAQYTGARAQPPLDLNQEQPQDIAEMEWRSVTVIGEYDFADQVAIRNQYNGNDYGYHLLTPLQFGKGAVLVDRGWVPAEGNGTAADWRKYDRPGTVTVSGQIRLGQAKRGLLGVADPPTEKGSRLEVWNNADLQRIAEQIDYPLLPVYIQPDPEPDDIEPPIPPAQPEIELTEGTHFGYALQWFTFAAILFIGYPFFLRKQESGSK